ncbi:MAG: HypC/HybG/HupF family hydrogenase formation chaperone [Pirellulaceae bacterium]
MCLGIPGQVVKFTDASKPYAQAEVEFDGVRRVCSMACVPDAVVGDYVIVHAGIAITRVDPEEANRVFDELAAINEDAGWKDGQL